MRKKFNLHGLVRLEIFTEREKSVREIMYHLSEMESPEDTEAPDIVLRDYSEKPLLADAFSIEGYYFYENGVLDIPPYRMCFDLKSSPVRVWSDHFVLPVNFLIEVALLRKGYTFLHSAGVQWQGRNFLFPAHGGTGKTALVTGLMKKGAKLFGDDLIVVGKGHVLGYPQDFSVYPYHVGLLGLKDPSLTRAFRKDAFLDFFVRLTGSSDWLVLRAIRSFFSRLKTRCVNVSPREIFGSDIFASAGKIDRVFFLSRHQETRKGISIVSEDPSILSRKCVNILLLEWHESSRFLYLYGALSGLSPADLDQQAFGILEQAFRSAPCATIHVPASFPVDEFQRQVIEELRDGVVPGSCP